MSPTERRVTKVAGIIVCVVCVFLVLSRSAFSTGALVGDVNGDGVVDLSDAVLLALAYGSHGPGYGSTWTVASNFVVSSDWTIGGIAASINWNQNADIGGYGTVNLADAVLLAINYGSHL